MNDINILYNIAFNTHMQKSKTTYKTVKKINLNIVSSFYKIHPKLDKIDVHFTLINNSQNSRYERVSDSS